MFVVNETEMNGSPIHLKFGACDRQKISHSFRCGNLSESQASVN